METKKISYLLLTIVSIVGVTIGIYYLNEDFRLLVRGFKYGNYQTDIKVTDDISSSLNNIPLENIVPEQNIPNDDEQIGNIIDDIGVQPEVFEVSPEDERILSYFVSQNLVENLEITPMFGIIRDFDSKYKNYTNGNLNLYLFGDYSYETIKQFFVDRQGGLEITINEVNNFGDKSFYINSTDSNANVRIVFLKNGLTYGIDISKEGYPEIKKILSNL